MKKFKNSKELSTFLRLKVLEMIFLAKSSHLGSNFSIIDIVAVLYYDLMKFNKKLYKENRHDRFILSKGHAGASLYAVLNVLGFISDKDIMNYYKNGSYMCGHITTTGLLGIDWSTGSLGHGLSISAGKAKFAKLEKKNWRVFCLASDGELDEGSNWESILFAGFHNLDNLTLIIDYNKLQSIKSVKETLNLEPIKNKFEAFNWNFISVEGHNHKNLKKALEKKFNNKKPTCILANTIKGKGVSFMENNNLWHYRCPDEVEFKRALEELNTK